MEVSPDKSNNFRKALKKTDLLKDYGRDIQKHLNELSEINSISPNYLSHQINGTYRGKMVDWMVEVLTAFKCSDQTFFLTVSLMNRYFSALCEGPKARPLDLSELHVTGVTCMFIASKYEDVYPLLMKTVFNKIGH